jgi:hypothetical protein
MNKLGLSCADMQKVETLPPADLQVKISAYWENQSPLVECRNFRQYSEYFHCTARLLGCFCMSEAVPS